MKPIQEIVIPFCYGSPVALNADRSSSLIHKPSANGSRSKIWNGRQVLTVFFMNEELIYEQEWTKETFYQVVSNSEKQLTVEQIMEWVETWNPTDLRSIPKFEIVPSHQADIRIKFSSMYL